MPLNPTASPYSALLLAGLIVSLVVWIRLVRRDPRLLAVYLGGVFGAFTGAKIVYLLAEGFQFWSSPDRWLIWATGKTIIGALFDDVCRPTGNPGNDKERGKHFGRNAAEVIGCGTVEVEVGKHLFFAPHNLLEAL